MSFKRPTEVSWDSDEDEELLNFNSKFKADDDEELDEDALLGSDDEDEFTQPSVLSAKKSNTATSHKTTNQSTISRTPITGPSKGNNSTGNRNANNNNSSRKGGQDAIKTRQITPKSTGKQSKKIVPVEINDSDPEPVLLLDPEESYDFDESGVSEIILDSSQGEEPEDEFVKPQPVTSRPQTREAPVRERQTEEEDQSDVSTLEVSVDQGQESSEDSDDSDNEHGRRRRFKTERQGSIKLSTHKAADIPDTLEISKEQEKEIEQFLHHGPNKNKSYRGRGRGNFSNMRGQQRMGLNQGQRSGPPANQNMNQHFPREAQPNQSHYQGTTPPVSKPQKIHINPHFRRAGMLPPRQGDGIMPTPAIPPLFRPQGPPSLLHIQPSAPIMHSAPQSAHWTSQANPQPMYSKPNPPHQVPHPQHPQHQFPSQQHQPRHSVPYSDYSRGPPSYPPQGHQLMRPPHVPHSRPPFHGQEFHQQNQFAPHGAPPPQPLLPQGHQFPQRPQHPSQHPPPLMRSEPQHQHHGQMGPPPPQHVQNRPPLHQGPQMQHPQYGQQFSQQRFPTPGHSHESQVRQNFNQQQQQPRFQQMGQGFQNQPRPQRFQSQGERMPHNLSNNAMPQHSVMKPKQNTVLHAHAKKLKERAKKFGQTPQMGPSRPTKPPKRPSTEAPSTDSSPVKQSKVEVEVLTPEDKELQEKLAMQAKQREMIRQRKEANRQALAQKKREQLSKRLAERGQSIEDIEQQATGNAQPNNPVNVNTAPKKSFPASQPSFGGQQIQTIHSNINQSPQRKVVNPNVSGNKPANQITDKPATANNKKLMRRIETVKKNAQGEIISREIKLVPIEDEANTSAKTSVLNQGRVQVVKKSIPVTAGSGNRSVISPIKNTGAGNRAVIRIGTDSEDSEEGDRRNVISQQPTGRRIVVTSKTKSVMVKNLSVSTSDVVIKNLCTTVGPVETIERKQKDAVITFKDGKHAAMFAEKYNRSLLDLSTILVSLVRY